MPLQARHGDRCDIQAQRQTSDLAVGDSADEASTTTQIGRIAATVFGSASGVSPIARAWNLGNGDVTIEKPRSCQPVRCFLPAKDKSRGSRKSC